MTESAYTENVEALLAFRFSEHSKKKGRQVIEIWDTQNNQLVGAIYPHAKHIRIISKFYDSIQFDEEDFPPVVQVRFHWPNMGIWRHEKDRKELSETRSHTNTRRNETK